MINISGLNKADILVALFNAADADFSARTGFTPRKLDRRAAQQILDASPNKSFDYLYGNILKIDLSGEEFDPSLYDRDNGPGAAYTAIKHLL